MRLNLNNLSELEYALSDIIGYLTDNSCGDPECCGGPFYTKDVYDEGVEILRKYGLEIEDGEGA